MCLIVENEKARLMKVSSNPDKYEVIEDGATKPFDFLYDARQWYNLISE